MTRVKGESPRGREALEAELLEALRAEPISMGKADWEQLREQVRRAVVGPIARQLEARTAIGRTGGIGTLPK